MFMTDQIKQGLIEALKYVLTEKGVLAVVTLGTWIALLAMFCMLAPDVVSTWKVAQEETVKSVSAFVEIQLRHAEIMEGVQKTLSALEQSNTLSERHLMDIERRLERIEEQTRLRQSSTITPRTLPAHDHRETYIPTREEYDRATMPEP